VPGVATLEVGGGQRDRELHGLVAGVEPGLLDVAHDALAALDGAAEVSGLAVDVADRDAGLDPGDPVGPPVLDEFLELQDGVVDVVERLVGAGVEQPGPVAHFVDLGARHPRESPLQVRLGVLGLAGLERQLGVVEGQADLVDHAPVGHAEQRLDGDAEAFGELLERRSGGTTVPGLDA
jgi:hypothetical protein